MGFEDNEKASELARKGAASDKVYQPRQFCGTPFRSVVLMFLYKDYKVR